MRVDLECNTQEAFMNSSRSSRLIVTARLIPTLLLLLFVAPYAPAQRDKKPSPAPGAEPTVHGNSQPGSSPGSATAGVGKKTDDGAERQPTRSTPSDAKQGKTSNPKKGRPSGFELQSDRGFSARSGRPSPGAADDSRTTDGDQPAPAKNSRPTAGAENQPSPSDGSSGGPRLVDK